MIKEKFLERINNLPDKPGVYLMRNSSKIIIYVGKAKNLKNRVNSYFTNPNKFDIKTSNLVNNIFDFEVIITNSEQEALILENNLIKQHKPKFNIRLKDDKTYPFIKVDMSEKFPKIYITREIKQDGSRYFGPYASAKSVRSTLNLLKKLFPYRSCSKTITGTDKTPCLDFHINRCLGPCIGAISEDEYLEIISQVVLFLEGKTDNLIKDIHNRMLKASDDLNFEKAAILRDQLKSIQNINQKQRVLFVENHDADIIAISSDKSLNNSWIEVFFVRSGKLVGKDNFMMSDIKHELDEDILNAFIKQFYDKNSYIPPEVIIQYPLQDSNLLEVWLSDKRKSKVKIIVPKRGTKRKLLNMVYENASYGLSKYKNQKNYKNSQINLAFIQLKEELSLVKDPTRIECYDISNVSGTNPVGSMVVFEEGLPKKSDYRKFKIKNIMGIDDYAMMREMLLRRFIRLKNDDEVSEVNNNPLSKWNLVPDLVLIDGGKGHLGVALSVFLELGINSIALASIAKENEEIFIPEMLEPIVLNSRSPALHLIQNIRDEAHRFAITFHRNLRSGKSNISVLDAVPGIGPVIRKRLLKEFGSIDGIRKADISSMTLIKGVTKNLAENIKSNI
ncbi:MAG: excinuclease ABC subunit C [Chloroflexi bacterium]|nr:excinuclease ABC subunit C [Chloroflexota bacterium]|tara:strand:- start:4047 stop:5900 length:1854 start_codon:yes stop_codon:yes gene_type:complete